MFQRSTHTPDCLPLSRLTQLFLLQEGEAGSAEREHLDSCVDCKSTSEAMQNGNAWRFESLLCEMYDELYPIAEQAYRKLNKT